MLNENKTKSFDAVKFIVEKAVDYKIYLRKIVPLPLNSLLIMNTEFLVFVQNFDIYVNPIFSYEDWKDMLDNILLELNARHPLGARERTQQDSFACDLNEYVIEGEACKKFRLLWDSREKLLNEFLYSPIVIGAIEKSETKELPEEMVEDLWKEFSKATK